MGKKLEKKKRYLLIWSIFCLLVTAIGVGMPVSQTTSLGLEGANQANLKTVTEELTEGCLFS